MAANSLLTWKESVSCSVVSSEPAAASFVTPWWVPCNVKMEWLSSSRTLPTHPSFCEAYAWQTWQLAQYVMGMLHSLPKQPGRFPVHPILVTNAGFKTSFSFPNLFNTNTLFSLLTVYYVNVCDDWDYTVKLAHYTIISWQMSPSENWKIWSFKTYSIKLLSYLRYI